MSSEREIYIYLEPF
jgi:hypothetical protein